MKLQLVIEDLDPAALAVHAFVARESIDDAYTVRVDFDAGAPFDPDALLGRRASFAVRSDDGGGVIRRWGGLIIEAAAGEAEGAGQAAASANAARVTLAPPFELLRFSRASRLYQNQSVPEVVQQVLIEIGVSPASQSWVIRGECRPRPCIVQRDESDHAFVKRLLAEEGIAFVHAQRDDGDGGGDGDGTRVELFDDSTQRPAIRGDARLTHAGGAPGGDGVVSDVVEEHAAPRGGATPDLGRIRGSSSCLRLEAGRTFWVGGMSRAAQNAELLLVEVEHRGDARPAEGAPACSTSWVAIRKENAYRPARAAAAGQARGPELAFVTGPAGEEIHVDEAGRVKVRFSWDRAGVTDERSSPWLRVGQPLLGAAMVEPRKGAEVVVDFERGRLAQPYVVGRLWNADSPPPYPLPENKARSAWRSATLGGDGGNQIRADDARGQQDLALEASLDLNVSVAGAARVGVGAGEVVTVGADRAVEVGGARRSRVGGTRRLSVGGNQRIDVVEGLESRVGGNRVVNVGAARTLRVAGDLAEKTSGAVTRTVRGTLAVGGNAGVERRVAGSSSVTVGSAWSEVIGGARIGIVGGARTEEVGALKLLKARELELVCGESYVVEADSVTSTCGGGRADHTSGAFRLHAAGGLKVAAANIVIEARERLTLDAGTCHIDLDASGRVKIKGSRVDLAGLRAPARAPRRSN